MGTGVLTYFALRTEPPFWLGIAIALPAACAVILLRRHLVPRTAAMALAATAIGFTSAQFATARALPQPSLPSHATILTGTVRSVEALVEGRRIAIDGARLDGGDALKRWLRVRLKKGDTEEIATGDMIRLRALVRPPMPPAYPGAWDLQRDAWYSGQGGFRLCARHRGSASPNCSRVASHGWCSVCAKSSRTTLRPRFPDRPERFRPHCLPASPPASRRPIMTHSVPPAWRISWLWRGCISASSWAGLWHSRALPSRCPSMPPCTGRPRSSPRSRL